MERFALEEKSNQDHKWTSGSKLAQGESTPLQLSRVNGRKFLFSHFRAFLLSRLVGYHYCVGMLYSLLTPHLSLISADMSYLLGPRAQESALTWSHHALLRTKRNPRLWSAR